MSIGPGEHLMKEIAFKLEQDADGWPPYVAEWLWLDEMSDTYIVKSTPFFISDLAIGDEIELSEINSKEEVTKWKTVSPSRRSVIWIADIGGAKLEDILAEFRRLGCNTSLLSQLMHASIDIPPEIRRVDVDAILDPLDDEKYAIAFPCDRQ